MIKSKSRRINRAILTIFAAAMVFLTVLPSYAAISASEFNSLCLQGDAQAIYEAIEAGADVNASYDGKTPLFNAISSKSYEAVAILLASGADPKARVSFDLSLK